MDKNAPIKVLDKALYNAVSNVSCINCQYRRECSVMLDVLYNEDIEACKAIYVAKAQSEIQSECRK